MALPNFLVIGAMKAGTTSLYNYLRCHPQVFMPGKKEPNFFTAEHNWGLGVGWYERLFEGAGEAVALGEASVFYTLYPNHRGVPGRISQVLPDVRLIYLVRHPVDRMVSHLWHDIRNGNPVEGSFEEALLNRPRFVNISRYSMQLEQYLDHFPLHRIMVIKSEDLRARREEILSRIFEFLGVGPVHGSADDVRMEWNRGDDRTKRRIERTLHQVPGYGVLATASPGSLKQMKRRLMSKKAPRAPRISSATRQELEDRVRDDVRRLRDFVGSDFDGWGIA